MPYCGGGVPVHLGVSLPIDVTVGEELRRRVAREQASRRFGAGRTCRTLGHAMRCFSVVVMPSPSHESARGLGSRSSQWERSRCGAAQYHLRHIFLVVVRRTFVWHERLKRLRPEEPFAELPLARWLRRVKVRFGSLVIVPRTTQSPPRRSPVAPSPRRHPP